jgi:hypothetical protein
VKKPEVENLVSTVVKVRTNYSRTKCNGFILKIYLSFLPATFHFVKLKMGYISFCCSIN